MVTHNYSWFQTHSKWISFLRVNFWHLRGTMFDTPFWNSFSGDVRDTSCQTHTKFYADFTCWVLTRLKIVCGNHQSFLIILSTIQDARRGLHNVQLRRWYVRQTKHTNSRLCQLISDQTIPNYDDRHNYSSKISKLPIKLWRLWLSRVFWLLNLTDPGLATNLDWDKHRSPITKCISNSARGHETRASSSWVKNS